MTRLMRLLAASAIALGILVVHPAIAELSTVIERIKPSIVAVGTYKKTDSPQFVLRGTGFAIGGGNLIATNAHVLPENLAIDGPILVVRTNGAQLRSATIEARDQIHDLAVLRIQGDVLPTLAIANSDLVREGQSIAFTGFPIGGALGFLPVTHRGMISSITPIALPSGNALNLKANVIKTIKSGPFNIFQIDGTAYPGNSGSPVFDTESGEVLGIINMVFIKSSKEAALSTPSGITYAIPANYLTDILR